MSNPRVCLIVLDGVGVGPAPDAAEYGDEGANTLGHIWEKTRGIKIPNLISLGAGVFLPGFSAHPPINGAYGAMVERSAGKDTTTGHWEIAGLVTSTPFPTFPGGFPSELIREFEKRAGRCCIGNKPASGTEIIRELGPEHQASGMPIVYTSADSVFQIAAHEDVIPVEHLYEICEIARSILKGPWAVGRVIARPFVGGPGNYVRTDRRRDFSLPPQGKTILDTISESGQEVVGIGKIEDIFAGRGLTRSIHTHDNVDGVRVLLEELGRDFPGLIFINLVDFDMKYGHRRDVPGFAKALEDFDRSLPDILDRLGPDDTLIITADHGNDPTHHGTDHTREIVPVFAAGNGFHAGCRLGMRSSFADIAATVARILSVNPPENGIPFTCGS